MLPKNYRTRYSLVIGLSLLVHLLVILILMWHPIAPEEKADKKTTVEIKLKQDKSSSETKKDEEEKGSRKKEADKQQDPEKSEPKKAEPKKSDPRKAEPKKSEPKKSEPKKSEPKKSEPKKSEPKKAEPKKAEPKKAEPKKAEPRKAEPRKAEPKKSEPNKQEAKKQEPKQAQEGQKTAPKDSKYTSQTQKAEQRRKDLQQQQSLSQDQPSTRPEQIAGDEPNRRFGSMEVLDERSMSRMVVSAANLEQRFAKQNLAGERIRRNFNFFQQQEFNQTMQFAFKQIEQHIDPPKWDGGKYRGEINFYVTQEGFIERIVLKTPSGHDGLDQSMIEALKETKRIELPSDPLLRKAMFLTRKLLYYSDDDMPR